MKSQVDTTDDYATELKRARKKNHELSKATWIVKALLVPVDDAFDKID